MTSLTTIFLILILGALLRFLARVAIATMRLAFFLLMGILLLKTCSTRYVAKEHDGGKATLKAVVSGYVQADEETCLDLAAQSAKKCAGRFSTKHASASE